MLLFKNTGHLVGNEVGPIWEKCCKSGVLVSGCDDTFHLLTYLLHSKKETVSDPLFFIRINGSRISQRLVLTLQTDSSTCWWPCRAATLSMLHGLQLRISGHQPCGFYSRCKYLKGREQKEWMSAQQMYFFIHKSVYDKWCTILQWQGLLILKFSAE